MLKLTTDRKTLAKVYVDFFATHHTGKRKCRGCDGTLTTKLDLRRREVALTGRLQTAA